jgi:hypothetical protein
MTFHLLSEIRGTTEAERQLAKDMGAEDSSLSQL